MLQGAGDVSAKAVMAMRQHLRIPRTKVWRVARAAAGLLVTAVLMAGLPVGLAARAAEPSCIVDGVDRIVAVGDVHGAADKLVDILRAADVIDARQRWSGGRTHLVQLGDVVDRGPDSLKALDLLHRLEHEATSAGGRVH